MARAREGCEDAAGAVGRAARRSFPRRRGVAPGVRRSRPRSTALPNRLDRPPAHGYQPRLPRRRCAGIQSARSSSSANQSAPSPRGELGRDRCACWPAEHQHDSGYLQSRAHGLSGDRPLEAARTCTHGAHPNAHLWGSKCLICSNVLGLAGPYCTARLSKNPHPGRSPSGWLRPGATIKRAGRTITCGSVLRGATTSAYCLSSGVRFASMTALSVGHIALSTDPSRD